MSHGFGVTRACGAHTPTPAYPESMSSAPRAVYVVLSVMNRDARIRCPVDPIRNPYAPGAVACPPRPPGAMSNFRTFDVVLQRVAKRAP